MLVSEKEPASQQSLKPLKPSEALLKRLLWSGMAWKGEAAWRHGTGRAQLSAAASKTQAAGSKSLPLLGRGGSGTSRTLKPKCFTVGWETCSTEGKVLTYLITASFLRFQGTAPRAYGALERPVMQCWEDGSFTCACMLESMPQAQRSRGPARTREPVRLGRALECIRQQI